MPIHVPHQEGLTPLSSADLLATLLRRSTLRNQNNRSLLHTLDAASTEVAAAGPLGLTLAFNEMRVRTSAEGLPGRIFGERGEIYVVSAVIDGRGDPIEHTTRFFPGIAAGDSLPIGEGGLLATWIRDPRWFVDIHMLVMESDGDRRSLGDFVATARAEAGLDRAGVAEPETPDFQPEVVARIVSGVDTFLSALAFLLRKNGDDHVATIHDFYLEHQAFGQGRHPATGRTRYQGVEAAYTIDLEPLGADQ